EFWDRARPPFRGPSRPSDMEISLSGRRFPAHAERGALERGTPPTEDDMKLRIAATGAVLLGALTLPGCTGGSGGSVQTLPGQAPPSAFAGYLGAPTLLSEGLVQFAAAGDLNGDGLP